MKRPLSLCCNLPLSLAGIDDREYLACLSYLVAQTDQEFFAVWNKLDKAERNKLLLNHYDESKAGDNQ